MADSEYIEQMEKVLKSRRAAVKVGREMKALRESAPTLFEIIDGEISLVVNKMTQTKALSYDDYIELHGQVVGIRRIRELINSKEVEEEQAAQEVKAIEENIKLVKNGG